jgi:beta-lactam-binding protein with PASTA domain
MVPKGSSVQLNVWDATVIVPNVVGQPWGALGGSLHAVGLRVNIPNMTAGYYRPSLIVVSQSPAPGSIVRAQSIVTVHIQ